MRPLQQIIFIFLLPQLFYAQSLVPGVVNAGGGTSALASTEGTMVVYYNIGEPIIDNIKNANGDALFTQGFLQPEIIGRGALSIYSNTTAMSCNSSDDASAILNTYGTNAPYRYKWFKNGVELSDTSSTLLNLGTGTYSFVVTDKNGNSIAGNWEVLSGNGPCKLIIHNGLSPNNDGHNDFFYVEYIGDYPANTVSIYNRWGDAIWDGSGYNNTTVLWKGEDNHGNVLTAGTYYYVIELEGKKLTGWVELMR